MTTVLPIAASSSLRIFLEPPNCGDIRKDWWVVLTAFIAYILKVSWAGRSSCALETDITQATAKSHSLPITGMHPPWLTFVDAITVDQRRGEHGENIHSRVIGVKARLSLRSLEVCFPLLTAGLSKAFIAWQAPAAARFWWRSEAQSHLGKFCGGIVSCGKGRARWF